MYRKEDAYGVPNSSYENFEEGQRTLNELASEINISNPYNSPSGAKFDKMTFKEWLDDFFGDDILGKNMLKTECEGILSVSAEKVSLL
jgi:hypothetical protein